MVLEPPFENQLLHVGCNVVVFQFNVQQALRAEFVQDIAEQGDRVAEPGIELTQLVVRQASNEAPAIRRSVDRVVMNDDQTAVTATTNVEFETGRPALQSFSERQARVLAFARIPWCATVSEHDHDASLIVLSLCRFFDFQSAVPRVLYSHA